jgi:hypothetical protein
MFLSAEQSKLHNVKQFCTEIADSALQPRSRQAISKGTPIHDQI